ncbi:MAG: PAS domain S-box protein [Nitrospinae bacterium]|nr:PAS domain S-box protein [Nitrospinota bacterium]
MPDRNDKPLGAGDEGALLAALFAATGALTLIVDAAGRVGRVNRALSDRLGVVGATLEGRPFWETLMGGDEAAEAADAFEAVRRGAERIAPRAGVWRSPEGARADVSWSLAPVRDPSGALKLAVVAGLDLTDHLSATTRLAETERRYHDLLDNLRDYVYTLTPEGKLATINAAFETITGWKPAEWIGRHYSELVHPDDLALSDGTFHRALSSDAPPRNQMRIRRKGGGYVMLEFSGRPLLQDGRVIGVSGIARDVTARVEAEERLLKEKRRAEEANRLKDQFLSLVSHDLRSPLAGVIGFLRFLDEGVIDPATEEGKDLIGRALATLQRLSGMVERLLNVGRLQSGRIVLQARYFSLYTLLEKVFDDHRTVAESKGVRFVNEIPVDATLYADPELLAQVFANLVTNAVKFCRKGDTVRAWFPSYSEHVVALSDTGPGIPARMIPNLFDSAAATSTKGSAGETGFGLGLPLCAGLVRAHGGDIEARSDEGKGSDFFITLPVESPRVALVGLDRESERIAKAALEALKEVRVAPIPMESLAPELSAWLVHMVVVDARSDREGGFALIQRLRDLDAGRNVPVVILSGAPDGDTARQAALLEGVRLCFDLGRGEGLVEAVRQELLHLYR